MNLCFELTGLTNFFFKECLEGDSPIINFKNLSLCIELMLKADQCCKRTQDPEVCGI